MFLAILTLVTALSISAVAIYYSVAGLVAIFAAAAVPIIIMGGALEISKLVTAVWLHKHWSRATWWLKTYLSTAVVVLMFITSMGIFGFLSKAHIEQTAAAGEGVAQIEQIEKEIARQQAVIARAEQIIETTQTSGTGADQNIQAQIDREQQRIDTAYDRVQPAIDATNKKLERDRQFYLDQLPAIEQRIEQFNELSNIDTTDEEAVKRLQSLVGTRPDGAYGGGTARAVRAYKEGLDADRAEIFTKIEELKANAQEEIQRLRSRAESEIDDSNTLIARLRSQLGQSTGEDIDAIIDEQNARIKAANTELDTLTEEKFQLEAEYRKLEAEVGPIKYIAEFIYGDEADKNLLEEAVRWVIIVIIIVFDPLAVLLLIASQYTFGWSREGNDETTEKKSDESDDDGPEPEDPNPHGPINGSDTVDPQSVSEEQTDYLEPVVQEIVVDDDYFSEENPVSREEKEAEISLESWNKMIEEAERAVAEEKDDDDLIEEASPSEKNAMQQWKAETGGSLKYQRTLFRTGRINELPWEKYLELEDDYKEDDVDPDVLEAAKWAEEQIEKSKKKDSDMDRETGKNTDQEKQGSLGYIQNSEQSESTIWQRVKQAKND